MKNVLKTIQNRPVRLISVLPWTSKLHDPNLIYIQMLREYLRKLNLYHIGDWRCKINISYGLLIIFNLREAAKVSLEDYLKLEREKKSNEESLMNQVTQLQNDKDELKTEIFKLKHKVDKVKFGWSKNFAYAKRYVVLTLNEFWMLSNNGPW